MEPSNYSNLDKTWLLDLDGTLVKHNGYKDGMDILLPGVKEFIDEIPHGDTIIILTARSSEYKNMTEEFLIANEIRFHSIMYNLPVGERILINDKKPSGLLTAYAYNLDRNTGPQQSRTL